MNKDLISIVIPTYNREKKLKRAIISILKQSYPNWELIIVDNNSSDKSEELVKSFKNNKIYFYKIDNNGIIAKSRNFGISKSNGDYVCFLDSDDTWHHEKLYYLKKYIFDGFDLIYHDMNLSNKKFFKKTGYCRDLLNPIYNDLLNNGPAFPTSSVCVNKKKFDEISRFNENSNFLAWEDYDAWLNFAKITEKFVKIPKVLGSITIDGENLLNNDISIKNIFSFKKKYYDNENLPNWALLSLVRSYYRKKNIKEFNFYLKKIDMSKLSFHSYLRIIFFKTLMILWA